MGGGTYSVSDRALRSSSLGYATEPTHKVFSARSINNAMSPHGVTVRESRDSDEHPESLAVIIALDVTGSMGTVPKHLVAEGLPHIMEKIIGGGVGHPQVMFMGIGDHECDRAPLQVGQFESSDELLDTWLTSVFLESGGGGNYGESYALAWYFAGQHTVIDCHEKRGQKGFLFTVGDEPVLRHTPASALMGIMGEGQYQDYTERELLAKAQEKYHVFHIHICETLSGSRTDRIPRWRELLDDNLLVAQHHSEVSGIIANQILIDVGVQELPRENRTGQGGSAGADAPDSDAADSEIIL